MRRLGAVILAVLVAVFAAAVLVMARLSRRRGRSPPTQIVVVPRSAGLAGVASELDAPASSRTPGCSSPASMSSGEERALQGRRIRVRRGDQPRAPSPRCSRAAGWCSTSFTLPEGLTSAEAMALLDAAPALDGAIDTTPPEGSLLPDTYFYVLGTRRQDLVARMQQAMDRALARAWHKRAPDLPFKTPAEALMLASIVEKETAHADERARIAGVYVERLRLGMRLQADPTVIYALTKGGTVPLGHPLDHADLAIASPYNTYLDPGLPPTPIDNPGLAAIAAALAPDERGELYFVADGTGRHNFARTLEEHNRNVAEIPPPAKQRQGAALASGVSPQR